MNRKSQVTLFIILGIIILAAGVTFFYMRSQIAEKELYEETAISETVPIEFDPVKVYVENCLEKTAIEGLKILGERGGYIDPYQHGFLAQVDVTEGSAVRFSQDWIVPYWWSLSSNNMCAGDCAFSVVPERILFLYNKPGKTSMESQLEEYVDEHLNDCLVDFNQLERQGYAIEEIKAPKTTVRVFNEEVKFILDYPIEATKISKKSISKFVAVVDLNLKDIYNLSSLLTQLEANYHYLERYMLDLIVASSAVKKEKLPPMSETLFKFGTPVTWSKRWVHQQLKDFILTPYIFLLKVYGTKNYELYHFPGDSYRTAFYNGNMLLPGDPNFNNLAVDFSYLDWQPYFDLNCKGDLCAPESTTVQIMSLFGIQQYDFLYDLSFPVLVTITDPDALSFGNDGYSFNFFLEGNIRNNEPMETDYITIESSAVSGSSMLCDYDKRISGEVTMNVKDSLTNSGLSNVQVTYSCTGETCIIEETDNQGNLKAKFPICFNGIVSFVKDGYITYSEILTTSEDGTGDIDVALNPILTKQFTIKKALMEKIDGEFRFDLAKNPFDFENLADLLDGETAIISLKRKTGMNEMPHITYAEFSSDQDYAEIQIAPGEYEIRIDLYYYGNFEIPERVEIIKIKKDPLGINVDREKVVYPAIKFNVTNPLPNGGMHCSSSGRVFIEQDISGDNIIVFKAISPNMPGIAEVDPSQLVIADLEEIGKLDDESYTQYCDYQLKPEYISK